MMNGFLVDLKRAGREYCGVRDTKHAKGVSIYAKNIEPNGITNQAPTDRAETYKTAEETKEAIAPGFQEARDTESALRESKGSMESGEDGN